MRSVSVSCKRNRIEGNDRFGREAAAIADSVKDISTLKRYVSRYDSLGERRAALLIRQRLGSVLRNSSAFDSAIAVSDIKIEIHHAGGSLYAYSANEAGVLTRLL